MGGPHQRSPASRGALAAATGLGLGLAAIGMGGLGLAAVFAASEAIRPKRRGKPLCPSEWYVPPTSIHTRRVFFSPWGRHLSRPCVRVVSCHVVASRWHGTLVGIR